MDELVRWLGEQLDEDAARAAQWHDLECEIHAHLDAGLIAAVAAARMLDEVPGAVCDCGGPARVLREIDADRALLAEYSRATDAYPADSKAYDYESEVGRERTATLEWVVRLRAARFSHRPGYREEWRP